MSVRVTSLPGYAVVSPVRNEAGNLRRLAHCLCEQTVPPTAWVVVDNGSVDGTLALLDELGRELEFVTTIEIPPDGGVARGGPITRAFHAGVERLDGSSDVIVKLDADLSFGPDYFERLLGAFAAEPALGIASGSCYELDSGGVWRQQFMTGSTVWGAARAYRWRCLLDVLPLDDHMGWDGLDAYKAEGRGWQTRTLLELPFYHHRREGERDGSIWRAWVARGRASHYMGYRPTYLFARSIYNALREPAAIAMVLGYASAMVRRESRYPDENVVQRLRQDQQLRTLPLRLRELHGRAAHRSLADSGGR